MALKSTTFESGKEYTLAKIFSGDNKIIIPDLQRDYCWGDKAWDKDKENHTELVSGFAKNLFESYKDWKNNKKNVTLGLIYGYEQPKHYIQLCDGQQRITTLFLLLGMLNRKIDNLFQKYLIPDYELEKDDKEPYLQYAIRESTLYFLSDLVCKFFLQNNITVSEITKQDWYFKEYDLDASIQSMIAALKTIEKELDNFDEYQEFGNFVLNNLEMIYYDMGDRKRGEETFVIINTTGEPLTKTENLKPILLGNLKEDELTTYSNQWEDREEWFWNNKNDNETTSDESLNDFFVWYWQIRLLQEKTDKDRNALTPKDLFLKKPETKKEEEDNPTIEKWETSVRPDTIQKYFCALKKVVEICNRDKYASILKTIKSEDINLTWFRNSELHVVLPLIAYLEKFPDEHHFYEFVRRIRRNYFDKKRKRGNFVDWRHIIQIIEFAKIEEEIFIFDTNANKENFKKIPNVELNEWYNADEKNKYVLKKEHKKEIEEWEDHTDLMDDLTPLWNANKGRSNSFENISAIYDTFNLLYKCYDENESNVTPNLSNYVRLYRVLIEDDIRIGHINRTSGMLGAWFSWRDENDNCYLNYLKNKDFQSLWTIKDVDEIISKIKQNIKAKLQRTDVEIFDDTFSAKKHLSAWLLLKTLNAENQNPQLLLSFYDGNGIASYDDCNSNKLNSALGFSLANSVCGYGVKSGGGAGNYIRYADDDWWSNPIAFDTIIGNAISFLEFQNRETIPVTSEKISEIDRLIQELLTDFYK